MARTRAEAGPNGTTNNIYKCFALLKPLRKIPRTICRRLRCYTNVDMDSKRIELKKSAQFRMISSLSVEGEKSLACRLNI